MVFWVPLVVGGGLWANFVSTKDLDEITTFDKRGRMLGGFWGGLLLGGILGLWVGVNFGQSVKQGWQSVDSFVSALMPGSSSSGSDKPPPPEAGPPSGMMQPPQNPYYQVGYPMQQ
mmetsp:Transcript_87209/g.182503  ORF Transcript_87209/g.182503 Transcript_87209/m.182503 type:complete len:116 (+) Transcript_87209:91-438(+)|eukprot:CAMPEP_0206492616 /NCGR_PEP_ID=MMETSP0324_2-20121206/46249_1 /ASSEMBLY_ACC=CAM_ASM_000836 /TAXON_ID=2866 /ORGANISM="Crypthecodinium cohnii, Strain Seligo" /LENGTH=115 /DNA_ID=CAMNT_0053975135 /DNA_START=62 /DNA_END=409 /DNA_ORIENTATION=-